MRRIRTIALIVITLIALGSGCSPQQMAEYKKEIVRATYMDDVAPIVIASVVGSSAPTCCPSWLHAIATDQLWILMFSTRPDPETVPSIYEIPDPNRPMKMTIRKTGEGDQQTREIEMKK